MKAILDYKKDFLCVLTESEFQMDGVALSWSGNGIRSTQRRRRRSGRW